MNMNAHIVILMIYKFWVHVPRSTCLSQHPCYFKLINFKILFFQCWFGMKMLNINNIFSVFSHFSGD